ncbi:hypothetical protein [Candidatus Ichthyocystis hellenicum]|uniref:hypothetical protein n=1 Tax=Candidatus Ichthyocystis hellenicum TaxID=1561003 RepID=UPI000B841C4D|nr:hypothetical protein [Candidatus Ichthyocystis hellenicum]
MNVPLHNPEVGFVGPSSPMGNLIVSQYDRSDPPRVSLKLLTQLNSDNSPIISVVRTRKATSISSTSMKTVIKVKIVPKNYMSPNDETTYLVIANSPMGNKIPTNDDPRLPSVKLVPLLTHSHGRSSQMSLIEVTSAGLKTSIKLEARIGTTISQYELLVAKLPQVYLETITRHNSDDLPILSIVNIRQTPRSGTSITVELAPKNAAVQSDRSIYSINVSSTRAANVYENFGQSPPVDIAHLVKYSSSRSPSLSLIEVTRRTGLKTLIKLEAAVENTKNQYEILVEEPYPTPPESSASA